LWIDHFDPVSTHIAESDTIEKFDYALLHFYRSSSAGMLVSYDLHLGDSVICRVKNNWKESIKINSPGESVLWAQTEAKSQLPLVIRNGKEYYIRCGISIGFVVGNPTLELMDNQSGFLEYQSINSNKREHYDDRVVLNSGYEIPCRIVGQDDENVYFIVLKKDREIRTSIERKSIKEINIGAIQ
jgi:hypothetical protein